MGGTMTLAEMRADVADDVRAVATDATVIARIDRYLNEAHNDLLRNPSLRNLRNGTLRQTTEANRATYGFAEAFDTIDKVTQTTNDRFLNIRSLDWLRQIDPGQRQNGTPTDLVDMGWQPVSRMPEETGVWAVSTNVADTTQSVRFRAVRANGDTAAAVTTLTGTSRVALAGGVTDLIHVTEFALSAACAGVVSLYDAAAAGNELARLVVGATSKRWKIFRFWPTPSAALDYVVDGQLSIYTLANDADVPMLPVEFHEMLPTYARMKWARYLSDRDRYLFEKSEFEAAFRKLRSYSEFPSGYRPRVADRQTSTGWNNLGAWYPADGVGSN
jgi:hypothetical protein